MTNSIFGIIITSDTIKGSIYMKDINDVFLNPVRIRIIQELSTRESMTASELCEKISDVPRTTLYRHINILLTHHILTIVSEKKIRGSLERTLALNVGEIHKHNTLENASQNAFRFLMNRYVGFHNYFDSENPNPGKDRVFLNNSILMMTDEEYDNFLQDLKKLMLTYRFENTADRKVRDISIISSPVTEKKKGNTR